MIRGILRKIKTFGIILRLANKEPNDYSFGYRVRRVLAEYREKKEIKEQEILKETPKP